MTKKGSDLHPDDKNYVLRAYVHRFTKDHKPNWANKIWKDNLPYPVQFESDQEWLENSYFRVKKDGRLDSRVRGCTSNPTFPDNPELRRTA